MCLVVARVMQLNFSLSLSSFDNALLKIPDFTVFSSAYIKTSGEVLPTTLTNISVNNVNANCTGLLQGGKKGTVIKSPQECDVCFRNAFL